MCGFCIPLQFPGARIPSSLWQQEKYVEEETPYLDVESLVVAALAATVGDVILRQLHANEILHDKLGVVVVIVVLLLLLAVIVVVVVAVVLVDQPAVSNGKQVVDSGFSRLQGFHSTHLSLSIQDKIFQLFLFSFLFYSWIPTLPDFGDVKKSRTQHAPTLALTHAPGGHFPDLPVENCKRQSYLLFGILCFWLGLGRCSPISLLGVNVVLRARGSERNESTSVSWLGTGRTGRLTPGHPDLHTYLSVCCCCLLLSLSFFFFSYSFRVSSSPIRVLLEKEVGRSVKWWNQRQEKEKKKKKKREKASGLYTKRQAEFRKTVAATFLARLAYFAIGRRRNVPSSFNGLARESSLISLSSSSLSIYIYYAYA